MEKVSREVATVEVEEWLNKKRIYQSVREQQKDSIDLLIDAVMLGDITIGDDNTITHKLVNPTGDIKEMKYKARISESDTRGPLSGVKGNDAEGRLNAYIQALTGTPKNIIAALDTSTDKKIALSIAVFFL